MKKCIPYHKAGSNVDLTLSGNKLRYFTFSSAVTRGMKTENHCIFPSLTTCTLCVCVCICDCMCSWRYTCKWVYTPMWKWKDNIVDMLTIVIHIYFFKTKTLNRLHVSQYNTLSGHNTPVILLPQLPQHQHFTEFTMLCCICWLVGSNSDPHARHAFTNRAIFLDTCFHD